MSSTFPPWSTSGVRYVFIAHAAYFEREYLYGAASRDYPDNPERFAFLSQAALTWAASTGQPYDIVHAHDWQAGLVPLMVQRTGPGLARDRAVRQRSSRSTTLRIRESSTRAGCRGSGSAGT